MKIKEVEQRVGITSKNIRFYEQEGLLTPKRDKENNYRNYSEEDVIRLRQIKILRVLGISIPDIKKIEEGRMDLESAMLLHVTELKQQEEELQGLIRICEQIAGREMSLEELDESIFREETVVLKERLKAIFREDTTKETITKKQKNFTVAAMLVYGYVLNAVVALVFGNYLLDFGGKGMPHRFGAIFTKVVDYQWRGGLEYKGVAPSKWILLPVLCIAAYIGIYLTSNMVLHLMLYHVAAISLTPIVAYLFNAYLFPMNAYFHQGMDANVAVGKEAVIPGRWNWVVENEHGKAAVNTIFTNRMYAAFWILLAVFVVLLYALYAVNERLVQNVKLMMLVAAAFSAVFAGVSYLVIGTAMIPALLLLVFSIYLAMCWTYLNRETEIKSRFYAIQTGSRIMNFFGMAFQMYGKTNGPIVYR